MVAENKILPVTNRIINTGDRSESLGGGYQPNISSRKKDRRKKPYDRRKSVREGVIVSLSFKKDRRKNPDRRSTTSSRLVPGDDSKGSIHHIIA
nr:hypothetical protein [uncultured Desulfobacter sp.]